MDTMDVASVLCLSDLRDLNVERERERDFTVTGSTDSGDDSFVTESENDEGSVCV